ncbi:hypothetical protein Esti_001317 [Eimeria stiedai]
MDGGREGGGPLGNDGVVIELSAERASAAARGQCPPDLDAASGSVQGLANGFRALAARPEEGPLILKYARRAKGPPRGGEGEGPSSPSGGSPSLRGVAPPHTLRGSLSLAGTPSEPAVSFELPAGRQLAGDEGGGAVYSCLSGDCNASDEWGWSTEYTAESAHDEASLGMQLSMLYEANKWFPQTNFYARMRANAQPQVDKKQAHRDAVTGRLRIGGFLFSLLLFMCITQGQSSIEDLPVIALHMGGIKFVLWASLLTSICSLPIMVTDVALGQCGQGSVLKIFNSLDRRMRGVGLALAIGGITSAILQSYISSIVMHFVATALGRVFSKINSDGLVDPCEGLLPRECAAQPRCTLSVAGQCQLNLTSAVSSFWIEFLTSSDSATMICNISCCLFIWLGVIYLVMQAPRVVGTVGACVLPCLFLLLPSLVIFELVGGNQKYGVGDLFGLPWGPMRPNDIYFCIIVLPLLIYMPGDGAVMTLASYDKTSHNPILISCSCFAAKWFVACMLLSVMYYAEGLAANPKAVQWSLVQDMRGLHALRSPPMLQGSTGHQHAQTSSFSLPCLRMPATSRGLKGGAAEEGVGCSGRTPSTMPAAAIAAAIAASASSRRGSDRDADASEWCADSRDTAAAAAALTLRRRRFRRTAADRASSEEGGRHSAPFSRVLRLLRIKGDPYEIDEDEKAAPENTWDSFRHHSVADALLTWWGGGENAEAQREGASRRGRGRGFKAGLLALLHARKLPLALLMFGAPAALSVLLVCFTLPMKLSKTPRFKAPVHYSMLVHADVLLRLLLASIKCVYVSWIFGAGQQVQRVGLLPLLLLSCCLFAVAAIPVGRALVSAENTDICIASLLLLALLFAALAAVAVVFTTANNLKEILSKGKGPQRPRRRPSGSRGNQNKDYRRSGARSLSLSLSYYGSPTGGRKTRTHARRGPLHQQRGPRTEGGNGTETGGQRRRSATKSSGRRRRNSRVAQLFLRLLKSNLYWAFIGNVEVFRASLNMALSSSPRKPLPMVWGWLLKFVATPWLLAELVEHAVSSTPKLLIEAEGPQAPLLFVLSSWLLFVLGLLVLGFFLPDFLEPLVPHHTVQLTRCWVPRASFDCRLSALDEVDPRIFDKDASFFSRFSSGSRGANAQQHRCSSRCV